MYMTNTYLLIQLRENLGVMDLKKKRLIYKISLLFVLKFCFSQKNLIINIFIIRKNKYLQLLLHSLSTGYVSCFFKFCNNKQIN